MHLYVRGRSVRVCEIVISGEVCLSFRDSVGMDGVNRYLTPDGAASRIILWRGVAYDGRKPI